MLMRLAGLVVSALLTACGGVDPDQRHTCASLIAAFEPAGTVVEIGALEALAPPDPGLKIAYRSRSAGATESEAHWIACRFAGRGLKGDRHRLVGVATDRTGVLDPVALFWLQEWLEITARQAADPHSIAAPAATDAPAPDDARLAPLYALQQLVNGVALACVYALLALGFTLVYGIIGRINFAFGELYMIGAVTVAIWSAVLAISGLAGWPVTLTLVLAVSLVTVSAQGWSMERLVFRPLRPTTGHAALIAAIGLSITLQEAVRLLQGAGDLWLPPDPRPALVLAEIPGFTLVANWKQLALLALTLSVLAGLAGLMMKSRFGRCYRACADDFQAARLLGVDVDRIVGGSFALGGALAGLAGFVLVEYYGVANFFMGFLTGFKALTAAIVGGIGSLPGAVLGAVLIALLETFWSGYFGAAYRDIAVFGLLAMVLVFRPAGLFGEVRLEQGLPAR